MPGQDQVMAHGDAEDRSGASDYALLHLAPAQTTTVVTTTTTTTTHFAPIRLPKSRPVRAGRSSFSLPYDPQVSANAPQSPLANGTHERGQPTVPDRALSLDPRMYPLSKARWPHSFHRWNLSLGDMAATYWEDPAEGTSTGDLGSATPAFADAERLSSISRGTERSSASLLPIREVSPLGTAAAAGERLSVDARSGPQASTNGRTATPIHAFDDTLQQPAIYSGTRRASPGPPRKRPRAESPPLMTPGPGSGPRRGSLPHGLSTANTGALGALPSPNQSPPSPAVTSSGEEDPDPKDGEPLDAVIADAHAQRFNFGSGATLSGLLSLPDLVDTFSTMPESMQSYLLFQLLRRSSVPLLQMVNQVVEPALRRDFLSELPPELGPIILGHLEVRDLCRSSLVCKTWRRMIDGDWRVWKKKLVDDGIWVGDGSDEREAREAATGKKDDLFLRRWEAGVWNLERRPSWNGADDRFNLYCSRPAERPEESTPYRLASPSSSRGASPAAADHFIHPFKLLYRRRTLIRRNWMSGTPERLVFDSGTPAIPPPPPGGNAPPAHVVTCLQFDDEKLISASDNHVISIFDTQTGRRRASLTGHDGGVWAMQYIGNTLVTGSTDKSVRVWDLQSGRCTHLFLGHRSTVRCLQIVEPVNVNPDPSGEPVWEPPFPVIVTGSRDWSLRVWKLPMPGRHADYKPSRADMESTEPIDVDANPYHLLHLTGHEHAVRALSASGRTLVSGSYDMTVRVWDVVTGECRHVLRGHEQKVYSVVYDPIRKQCASGSMDFSVRLWSTETGECRAKLEGHTSLVGLLGLSHRHLVSAAADFSLRVWDPETGRCRHQLEAHQGAITCFHHDEDKVISGSDGTLKLWDIRTGMMVRDLISNLTGVWQVAADHRYCIAAVSRNGRSEYEILDFGSVDPIPTAAAGSPQIKSEDFDDGARILSAARAAERARERRTEAEDTDRDDRSTPSGGSVSIPTAPRLPPSAFQVPRASSRTARLAASDTPSRSSSSTRSVRRTNNSRDLHGQASTSAAANAQAGPSSAAAATVEDTSMEDVVVKEEDTDEMRS
ncbi:SCF ubiquitin ligase complex subunit cdc4 [Rhodotorula sphaerocarpa]